MQLAYAEPVGRARCFLRTRGGELGAGGDVREVGHTFGAIGGDDEMSFPSFSCQFREQWSNDSLIVRVGEHRENRPARLSPRQKWQNRSESRESHKADISTH